MRDDPKRRRFDELVRSELDALYRTSRRMIGSDAVAEEIVQEACLKAYASFDVLNEPDCFRSWMHRIAINLSLDHLRRSGREVSLSGEADRAMAEPIDPAPRADPARQLDARETAAAISAALAALAPDLRAVAVLVIVEEVSYAQAAMILGLSVDRVRSRLHRARGILKERLAEHMGEGRALPQTESRSLRDSTSGEAK